MVSKKDSNKAAPAAPQARTRLRSAAPLSVPVWTYSVLQTNIYAQVIDDVSRCDPGIRLDCWRRTLTEYGGNKEAAKKIGQLVG